MEQIGVFSLMFILGFLQWLQDEMTQEQLYGFQKLVTLSVTLFQVTISFEKVQFKPKLAFYQVLMSQKRYL